MKDVCRISAELLRSHGDAAALTDASSSIDYATLAERAGAVAARLLSMGASPGTAVAIVSGGRGFDEAVGLAGILCAGCTVVPLDATAPPARIATIVQSSGVAAVVHDGDAPGARGADATLGQTESITGRRLSRVVLTASGEIADAREGDRARELAVDEDIACVLHTSGSTGTPKPVPITWQGLSAFTTWAAELIELSPRDRVLRVAELVFDLAWFDHIASWQRGANLLLLSRRTLAAGRSAQVAIAALEPTVIYGVPSLFMKIRAAGRLPSSVRAVFFAGEVFPPSELAAFADATPSARLFNFFGPTETNVCTFHAVDRVELDGKTEIPIGVACPYATCELLDDAGSPIPGAGVGELWVTGPTALGGGPFPTRDRVERDDGGRFHFRGRIDRMVKVRGYRVEPGDVEAALCAHPAVRRAAVVTRDDPRLGKVLWAYVETPAGAEPGSESPPERQLRAFVGERLPPYMVPDRVVPLDALPETTTGKIDYGSLEGPT